MLASLLPVAGIAVMSVLAAYYYQSAKPPTLHAPMRPAVVLLIPFSLLLTSVSPLSSFTRSPTHASPHQRLLLFDGVCNVCNVFVNFVLDFDTAGSFYFVPLQSAVGQQLLHKYNLPADLDSMVLIDYADDVVRHIQTAGGTHTPTAAASSATFPATAASSSSSTPTGFPLPPFPAASPSVAYIRSTAALVTVASLPFPLSLACLLLLLPLALRDTAYKAFAAVRYRLFGVADECRTVTKEGRKRFLDGSGGASTATSTRKDK